MAADNSFDIVSKVDIQEVRNAIDQASKEVHNRFDLKTHTPRFDSKAPMPSSLLPPMSTSSRQ